MPETPPGYPIAAVCQRTGLTPPTLRSWERRYGVVQPQRSAKGQRRYTEQDIERLTMLMHLMRAGYHIGAVVGLPPAALHALVNQSVHTRTGPPAAGVALTAQAVASMVTSCLSDLQDNNGAGLLATLKYAALSMSRERMLRDLLSPLLRQAGLMWDDGELGASHARVATLVVREYLQAFPTACDHLPVNAPRLAVATPTGCAFEFGALLVCHTAADWGWQVTYLGPGLSAVEIAAGACAVDAPAVYVSVNAPQDAAVLPGLLQHLRQLLPDSPMAVGGAAAADFVATIHATDMVWVSDLAAVSTWLDTLKQLLRSPPKAPA